MPLTLLLILFAGGAAYFLARGVMSRSEVARMTHLEVRRAELESARAREDRLPPKVRLALMLRRYGYDGDLFPFAAGLAFLYLFVLVAIRVIGLGYSYGAVVALPASALTAMTAAGWAARRRRRRFNQQLIELLDLLAGQVMSGHGAQKALQIVVPNMQEPMRAEMIRVLDARVASKDLISSMKLLAERYPSRAMGMFISALEIDQAEGHAIGPALQQAAALLKQDFALAAEANAEISQTRGEFFGVIALLGAIAAKMILGGDSSSAHAYASPLGLTVLIVGFANVAVGVVRFTRLLNNVRGDT